MIVWRGHGFIAMFVAVLGAIGAHVVINLIAGDQQFFEKHWWTFLVAGTVGAICVGLLWHFYLARDKGRTVIDKATGKEIVLRAKHDVFFISVRYWPYIIFVLSVLVAFANKEKLHQ